MKKIIIILLISASLSPLALFILFIFALFNIIYVIKCLWEFKIFNYKETFVEAFTQEIYDGVKKKIVKVNLLSKLKKEVVKLYKDSI